MTTQFTKILLATFCLFGMNWCLGNFAATCTNIHLQNNILWASCRKINGATNHSGIDLVPIISNQNGWFSWTPSNYQLSCYTITLNGTTLSASCKKINQVLNNTTINLNDRIANIDGVLQLQ